MDLMIFPLIEEVKSIRISSANSKIFKTSVETSCGNILQVWISLPEMLGDEVEIVSRSEV